MLPLALMLGIGVIVLFAVAGYLMNPDGLTVRLVSLVVDVFFLGIAFLIVRELREHDGGADYAWLLVSALGIGALLHALGLLDWYGDVGFAARTTGTVLVCVALLIPSTLTLALPLAAFLALSTFSSGRTADRPRPSPQRLRSDSRG